MILLFAPDMRQAEWWCRHQEEPINPKDSRKVMIVTPATGWQRLRGFHLTPDKDRVVIYNSNYIHNHTPAHVREHWYELMEELHHLEVRSPEWDRAREYMDPT